MCTRFDEKNNEVQMLIQNQFDMANRLLLTIQEFNRKDVEISNLKFENEHLKNQMKHEKELIERLNKHEEYVRYYEELMRSQRRLHETFGLGYTKNLSSTKEGESSKSGEKRNVKPRNKPT